MRSDEKGVTTTTFPPFSFTFFSCFMDFLFRKTPRSTFVRYALLLPSLRKEKSRPYPLRSTFVRDAQPRVERGAQPRLTNPLSPRPLFFKDGAAAPRL